MNSKLFLNHSTYSPLPVKVIGTNLDKVLLNVDVIWPIAHDYNYCYKLDHSV